MIKSAFIILCLFLLTGCDNLFFEDTEGSSAPLSVFDSFYHEVDRNFSFFEYLDEDFDSAYSVNRVLLEANPSHDELKRSLDAMIQVLKDGHSNVFLQNEVLSYTGWFDQYPVNQLPDIAHYFSEFRQVNDVLQYGIVRETNLGYIKIRTFTRNIDEEQYRQIDGILSELSSTDGIIIDVRSNSGGSSRNADLITSRFNDEQRLAFQYRRRDGPARTDFTEWMSKFTDLYSGDQYLKPVVVLTNRICYSATEWFISNMRTIPHVTIMGDTTGGGSGNPIFKELPNGWALRVSNTQKQLPEGRDFQYTGIYPDVPVWITRQDSLNGVDTILETGIQLLKD